jgi:hypothetical protein
MPNLSDFIDGTYQPQEHNSIKGIGSSLNLSGIDNVTWKFIDVKGKPITIWLTCLHIPDISCCLLPSQQVASQGMSKLPEGIWIGRGKSATVMSLTSCMTRTQTYHPARWLQGAITIF